jgi:hypothetical protein
MDEADILRHAARKHRTVEVLALLREGKTPRQVAELTGYSVTGVYAAARRNTLPRRPRKRDQVAAVFRETGSVAATSERLSLSKGQVRSALQSYRRRYGPDSLPRALWPAKKFDRFDVVADYRRLGTLRAVGALHGVSRERVRQLLVAYERATGDRVPRTRSAGKRGPRVERVPWTCPNCGAQRQLLPRAYVPELCVTCRRRRMHEAGKLTPLLGDLIARRAAGETFGHIAASLGMRPSAQHQVNLVVWTHLTRANRLAERDALFEGYSTGWLERRVPTPHRVTETDVEMSNDRVVFVSVVRP